MRSRRTPCRAWLFLLFAGLFLQAPLAAGQEPPLPPQPHLTADVRSRLAEAAGDSTLAPWQREFMLEVVRGKAEGSATEPSLAAPGVPLQPTGSTVDDGAWIGTPWPSGRYEHTAIYDPIRDRMIVFGGSDGRRLDDVWTLTLSGSPIWTQLYPSGPQRPARRYEHGAIYDPVRDRIVVFGGADEDNRCLNDVWVLTLTGSPAWSQLYPSGTLPAGRWGQSAIYDPLGDRMVVFGGACWYSNYNDVWVLSLAGSPAWTQLSPMGTPPASRSEHTAIYDSVRDRMVVFGGYYFDGTSNYYLNDVWALSLSGSPEWSGLAPAGTPPAARAEAAAIYDPVRDRMVVFGGYYGSTRLNDAWALSLSGSPAWSALSPSGTPPTGRLMHTAIYDPARDRMIVFGGHDGAMRKDAWVLSLSASPAWSALAPPSGTPPTARLSHTAIYDPVRDRMIMFGGHSPSSSDVWALTLFGSPAWSQLSPVGTPPAARSGHTAIYDPAGDRMVVFGGYGSGYLNDAWSLSLSGSLTWSQLFPSGTPPSARSGHTAIYDPAGDRMVVFGGSGSWYLNDAWSLSLSGSLTWSQLFPSGTPPSVRSEHTAIYDPAGDRMVVFGGYVWQQDNRYYNDVWALSLSGSPAWSQLSPSGTLPTGRSEHTAIYDPVRDRMVVFGGFYVAPYPGGPPGNFNDVWALSLSGSPAWSQLSPSGTLPLGRYAHSAIYDPGRDRMVVFGGAARFADGSSYYNDQWALAWDSPAYPPCANADAAVLFSPGTGTAHTSAANMLGPPDAEAVPLGLQGSVTLRLSRAIVDGPGVDFYVYENGAAMGVLDENFRVEVSADGISFTLLGEAGGGTWGFDLAAAGIALARYVRITDLLPDESGTPPMVGADIDAVEVVHCGASTALPGPSNLTATPVPCTDRVDLAWQDNSSDEAGFEIEAKPEGFSDDYYRQIATPPANATTLSYRPSTGPLFGFALTYRVRAVRGIEMSGYSNEASAQAGRSAGAPPAPAAVSVRSAGDAASLVIRVKPPNGSTSWAGITRVRLRISDGSSADDFMEDTPGAGDGELKFVYPRGEAGRAYTVYAQNEACGTASEETEAPRAVEPRQRMILFLHGIWSRGDVWEDWDRWFADKGLLRHAVINFLCPGDTWKNWAGELEQYLANKFAGDWQDDEDIDIVAWSQGGLAARAYIEAKGDAGRVRSLFMIGTPNHGGELSTLQDMLRRIKMPITACDRNGLSQGSRFLIPNSQGLRDLNFEPGETAADGLCQDAPVESRLSRRQSTRYYTVGGTGDEACSDLDLFCRTYQARRYSACAGDFIVPWKSVRLRALTESPEDCYQWLDVDIPGETRRYIHHWAIPAKATLLWTTTTYLGSRALADHVANVLMNGPSSCGHGSMCPPLACEEPAHVSTADEGTIPLLISSHDDSLGVGVVREHTVWVDACSSLTVFVSSELRRPQVQLMTPDSVVLTPADTASVPGLSYQEDDSLAFAAFGIDGPTPGLWTVRIAGNPGPETDFMTTSWVSEGGAYRLVAGLSSEALAADDTLLITARLDDGSGPVTAVAGARVSGPAGEEWSVALNDAGLDGDLAAGDGTYSGRFVAPAVGGGFEALVTAVAQGSGERTAQLGFEVIHWPDVELRPASFSCTPLVPMIGQPADLNVWVFNVGQAAADSVDVLVFDSTTGDSLAAARVSMATGDSALVTLSWTPLAMGLHRIRVEARLEGAAEAVVQNNVTEADVPVGGNPALVGVSPTPPPSRFELAPPRPNPSRGEVTLDFALPQPADVSLAIYDVAGRLVRKLVDGPVAPGRHSIVWDSRDRSGRRVSTGVYLVRFAAPGAHFVRKAVFLQTGSGQ